MAIPAQTDKEALLKMLTNAGIKFKVMDDGDIRIEDGYIGFFTDIEFNTRDELKRISAWE